MILHLLFAYLIILFPGKSEFSREKCDFKYLEDKSFYGEFTFYSGTTFLMYMEISKVKECEVEGILYWPDYFSSRTAFAGKFKNNTLNLSEHRIIEGMIMDIEKSYYTIEFDESDTLNGTAFANGKEVATFRIVDKDVLSESDFAKYTTKFDELQSVYGQTIIQEPANITLAELQEKYKEATSLSDVSGAKLTGTGTFGQIELPILMYYKPPSNFYMEMPFQNLKFLSGKNDSISWSYDPAKDEVSVKKIQNDPEGFEQFSKNFLKNTEGDLKDVSINHAMVSGTPAFRVAFKKNEAVEAHYLSRENFQVIREEMNNEIKEYLNYTSVGNALLPRTFVQKAPGGVINGITFEQMVETSEFPLEIFNLPEELKAKVSTKEGPTAHELANNAFEAKNYARANTLYSKAIENYPYDDALYYNRGRSRYELGENYKAIGDFERAIDLNDEVGGYHNYLGLVKYRLGDYENAKVDFQRALQKDSLLNIAYLNVAFACYQLDEPDTAIIYLTRGIINDSTNGQFYLNRGIIYAESERYAESLYDYEQALKLKYGDTAEIQNRLGVSYFRLEKYAEAADLFQKALLTYPENFQIRKNLGNAYYHSKQYKKATAEYQEANKINPEDDDLLNYLAMSYYNETDYDMSLYYLDQAIELSDDNATYYDNRAYTYAGMMKYQEAIEDFTRSIELYPKDPEVFYQRGTLYRIQNSRFDACRDFRRAVEYGHEGAKSELNEYCQLQIEEEGG